MICPRFLMKFFTQISTVIIIILRKKKTFTSSCVKVVFSKFEKILYMTLWEIARNVSILHIFNFCRRDFFSVPHI